MRRRGRPTDPLEDDEVPPTAARAERGAARAPGVLLDDLGQLQERQRGALLMRELGGLDFDEIAGALEASPAAARQVLYEARRSLHE